MSRWLALAVVLWGCGGSKDSGQVATTDPTTTPTDTDTDTDTDPADMAAPVSAVTLEAVDGVFGVLKLTWTQETAADMGWIAFTADGKTWHESPHSPRGVGGHEAVAIGLPLGSDVTVKIVQEVGGDTVESADTWTAVNSEVPEGIRVPDVTWDPDLSDPAPFVFGSIGFIDAGWANIYAYVVVWNRAGELVWALPTFNDSWSIFPRIADDGTHVVVDASTAWCCPPWDGSGSQLHRLTLDGQVLDVIDVDGLHHSWDEMADGTVLWGSISEGNYEVLKRRALGGDEEIVWESQPALAAAGDTAVWAESNTVNLAPDEQSVLFSFYSHETVFEIDLATGDALRQFGDLAGSYAFDPPDSQFWWQHGVHYTDEGTLMVSTHELSNAPANDRQMAREYTVDDKSQTLHEVWNYVADDVYSDAAGEAYRTPTDNVLINYGQPAHIREITPDGTVVWDADWGQVDTAFVGHTTLVDDLYTLVFTP